MVNLTVLLAGAGIEFQVGGSALLHALGLIDRVRDLDVVFRVGDRERIGRALEAATGEAPRFDVRQEPGFVSGWRGTHRFHGVELDMTAGIALEYPDGFVARLPFRPGRVWDLGGVAVPLAPLTEWLLVYRWHNPSRSELLAPLVPDADWRGLLEEIGAPEGFDGFRDGPS
jgi:hypothetical protein